MRCTFSLLQIPSMGPEGFSRGWFEAFIAVYDWNFWLPDWEGSPQYCNKSGVRAGGEKLGKDNTEPQRKEGFKGSQPRSLQTRPALPRIIPRKAPQNQRGLNVSVQINKITKIHHTTSKESLGKRFSCKYRVNWRSNLWNSLPLDVLTALIWLL